MPEKTIKALVRVVKKKKRLTNKRIMDKRQMYEKRKDAAHPRVIDFKNAVEKFFMELNTDDFSDGVLRLDGENVTVARTMADTANRFTERSVRYDAAVASDLQVKK